MIEEKQKKEFLELNEVGTFFLINECGAFIWRMSHDMAHGRIPDESHAAINADIINIREIQQFAVDNLTRFGIDPESAKDQKDGDYWKWFHFWNDWKKGLTNEEWNAVNSAMSKKESYEQYLPKTTWKN